MPGARSARGDERRRGSYQYHLMYGFTPRYVDGCAAPVPPTAPRRAPLVAGGLGRDDGAVSAALEHVWVLDPWPACCALARAGEAVEVPSVPCMAAAAGE